MLDGQGRASWPQHLVSGWGTAGLQEGADEKGVSSQQPARPLDSGQTVPVDQATSLLGKTCLDMGWEGEVGVPQGQPIPGVTMLPEEAHPAWLAKFSHVQLPAQER